MAQYNLLLMLNQVFPMQPTGNPKQAFPVQPTANNRLNISEIVNQWPAK